MNIRRESETISMSMKAFAPAIGQFRGGDSLFQSQVEANAMERLLGRTSERRF